MAPPDRRTDSDLIDHLEANPSAFDFFQAVMIMEAAVSASGGGAPPVGQQTSASASQKTLTGPRFSVDPTLHFPPSDIRALNRTPDSFFDGGATLVLIVLNLYL